jgi:tetratricopeptide (TPR) repeat protein
MPPLWAVIVASAVVPGAGHLLVSRFGRGLAFAAAAAGGLALALASLMIYTGSGDPWRIGYVGAVIAAGSWVWALADSTKLRIRIGRDMAAEERETRFAEALERILRKDYDEAIESLKRCLALYPYDPDVYLRLAGVYRRMGDRATARKALRTCRNLDSRGKWRWEVRRELEALRGRSK